MQKPAQTSGSMPVQCWQPPKVPDLFDQRPVHGQESMTAEITFHSIKLLPTYLHCMASFHHGPFLPPNRWPDWDPPQSTNCPFYWEDSMPNSLCGGALASNTRARSRVKPTQRHPFSWKQHKSKQLQVFASFCIHSMPWETPKKQYMACLCHCRLGFGFTRDSYATTNAASKPGFKQLAICRWLIAMPGCNDAPSCFKPFHCLFSWYTSVGSIVTLS